MNASDFQPSVLVQLEITIGSVGITLSVIKISILRDEALMLS